jgi:hypothetical protein
MNKINKISDITVDNIVHFLRLPRVDEDTRILLESYLDFAKAHAVSYTNRTIEELDEFPETAYAILVECSDYYKNRSSDAATKGTTNSVFENVFGPYRVGRIGVI